MLKSVVLLNFFCEICDMVFGEWKFQKNSMFLSLYCRNLRK